MNSLLFINALTTIKVIFAVAHLASIYYFVDIFRSRFKDTDTKLFWIFMLLLIPGIGMILYSRTAKNDKIETLQ